MPGSNLTTDAAPQPELQKELHPQLEHRIPLKSDETVTVIMPVRAETATDSRLQKWFKLAVESLLQQSHSHLEILLVGDNERKFERWLPADIARSPQIHVISREAPGLVDALNTGIVAASGNLIARMDADDIAAPDRIKLQLQLLQQHPEITFCATRIKIFNDTGVLADGSRHYQQWLNSQLSADEISRNIFVESPLPHPSWMLRRQVYEQLQGYRDVEWAEDYDFVLRAWLAGFAMAKPGFEPGSDSDAPETTLVSWRDHDLRLTRNDQHYSRKNFLRAKAWALSESVLRHRDAIILGTGSNAKRLHDALKDYNVSVSCFVELNITSGCKSVRQLPVIDYKELASDCNRDELLVSAVTRYGARAHLRQWFDEHNMTEGLHYIIAG